MAYQAGSARFQAFFESALHAYDRRAGVTLAQHPLAVRLQRCRSTEDITTLLQGKAQAFGDVRASDKITKSIKATMSSLIPLSNAATLADAVGPVRQNPLIP